MILSDSQKLERLFDLYEKKMYGTAFQILRDEGQAEDAVQDAFLRVMAHISRINQPESVETQRFMVKVIRSAAIDIYRKNRKERENTVFDPEDIQKTGRVLRTGIWIRWKTDRRFSGRCWLWIKNIGRYWSFGAILASAIKRLPSFLIFRRKRRLSGISGRNGSH